MAMKEDIERGVDFEENGLVDPLIKQKVVDSCRSTNSNSLAEYGEDSLWMVLLSTAIAVCGSFEFGLCVRTLFSTL